MTLNTDADTHKHTGLDEHIYASEDRFMLSSAHICCIFAHRHTSRSSFKRAQTWKHTHINTVIYYLCLIAVRQDDTHQQVHSQRLVLLPPYLLSFFLSHTQAYIHTHAHTCPVSDVSPAVVWLTAPPCLCIRCHSGSNVMSLASCGPSRKLMWLHTDTTKLAWTIERLSIGGVRKHICKHAHM